MKYLLIIIISSYFVGCYPKAHKEAMSMEYYGIDFTAYSSKGFLFTPEKYSGEYSSIGLINVDAFPEVKEEKPAETEIYTTVHSGNNEYYIMELPMSKVLTAVYTQATSMGADALINFKATRIYKQNGLLDVPGYNISGYAIKRIYNK